MNGTEMLESKLAFLEQAINQLSDEVLHQRTLIEKLQARLEHLAMRQDAAGAAQPLAPEDERPPHY